MVIGRRLQAAYGYKVAQYIAFLVKYIAFLALFYAESQTYTNVICLLLDVYHIFLHIKIKKRVIYAIFYYGVAKKVTELQKNTRLKN